MNDFLFFLCPGDRLRGSEAELAGAVGAVEVEEGDSDWEMVDQNSCFAEVTKSGPLWLLSRIMFFWCIDHSCNHLYLAVIVFLHFQVKYFLYDLTDFACSFDFIVEVVHKLDMSYLIFKHNDQIHLEF